MKLPITLFLPLLILFISGCSQEKQESEADKKDHFLRQQIDTINDAKSVTQTINRTTASQDEQAAQLAGHK